MNHSIKLFAFVFFFCINCFVLKAQQKHFIYVQSEDKQQFAIVLKGKVYSSSDYGYVIIPNLTEGDYDLMVSFPMNKFPEQAFTCTINKKDAGYILKNNTTGWALQNMQTQKLLTNDSKTVAQQNAFGDMLSQVVNDSDLTRKSIPADNNSGKTTGAVAGTFAITQAGDTLAIDNTGLTTDSKSRPEKISESKLDTGTNMLFVDRTQSGIDTINIFVPAEKTEADLTTNEVSSHETAANSPQHETPVVIAPAVNNDAAPAGNNITTPTENPPANNNTSIADNSTHEVSNPFYKPEQNNNGAVNSAEPNQTSTVSVSNGVNQDCAGTISDEELNKLKRKMFGQDNDNDMIQYALKYVSKKCITTEQVKSLGSLFSTDDGRYNLYDAMYKHVYDYGNYPGLADLIVDPYYKKRFAALLR